MLRSVSLIAAVAAAALFGVTTAEAAPPKDPGFREATVCLHGAYADLFPQDGAGTLASPSSMFAKQVDCMRWIREGGAVGKLQVDLIPGPSVVGLPGTWMALWFTISGAATSGGCILDPALPYALSVTRVGYSGGSCIGPFVEDEPFEAGESGCRTPEESFEYNVLLATSSGGVVGRTVARSCT